ncbi:hypothetical protein [Yinghuangia soli]|uniref:DUF2336 domain-containing protein n=1 Tax=Yinghuangia soli TaxID=2908204 RepID=A0AA41Q3T6_9ACTN|nr:hypothetical protein [Yinghuangia soli]MCF2530480.1 hypothetical protein [Yinghuangia soli]
MITESPAMLLAQVPPPAFSRVLARLDLAELDRFLGTTLLPTALVDRIIANGTTESRMAITENPSVTSADHSRLLDLNDARVARAVFSSGKTTRALQQRVLTLVPPASLIPGDREFAPETSHEERRRLYPLMDCDDPAAIKAAIRQLSVHAGSLGAPTALLRGFQRLAELGGLSAVRDAVDATPKLRPAPHDAPPLARVALATPTDQARVASALDWLGSTEYLAEQMENSAHSWADVHLLLLAPRAELDWDLLAQCLPPIARHRYGTLLAREPGCPPELRPRTTPRDRRRAREDAAAILGENPDAWLIALRLLPTFPGPMHALLETASAAAR